MRNLKRALSLTLASVMLLGMMVVGTSALSFKDSDQITNVTAASVMEGIGVFEGDNVGNFLPNVTVTRAQMAAIMGKILYGAKLNASQFGGVSRFADVPVNHYATPYINLVNSLGLMNGTGGNNFAPDRTITTAEAALLLCRALGYFDTKSPDLTGEWGQDSLTAVAKATDLGLFEGLDLSITAPLNRDNVAAMTFNAITRVVPVEYNERFDAYYTAGRTWTDGVAVLDKDDVGDKNTNYRYTLGWKNFDLELEEGTGEDDFGRSIDTWKVDKTNIVDVPAGADYVVVMDDDYTGDALNNTLIDLTGVNGLAADADAEYWINGTDIKTLPDTKYAATDVQAIANRGTVVEVYLADGEAKKYDKVVAYNYTLYKISDVDDNVSSSDARKDVSCYVDFNVTGMTKVNDTDIPGFNASTYVKDAYVAMVVNGTDIIDSYIPEVVNGSVSTVKGSEYITIDGTRRYFGVNYAAGAENLTATNITPGNDNEYDVYLDKNGVMLGVKEIEGSAAKLDEVYYLDTVWETTGGVGGQVATYHAQVVSLADGTIRSDIILETEDHELVGAANDLSAGGYDFTAQTGVLVTVTDKKETNSKANNDKFNLKIWDNGVNSDFDLYTGVTFTPDSEIKAGDSRISVTGSSLNGEANSAKTFRLNANTKYIFLEDTANDLGVSTYTGGVSYVFSSANMSGAAPAIVITEDGSSLAQYMVIPCADADTKGSFSEDAIFIKSASSDKGDGYREQEVYLANGNKETWQIDEGEYPGTFPGFFTYSENDDGYYELDDAETFTFTDGNVWDDEEGAIDNATIAAKALYEDGGKSYLTLAYGSTVNVIDLEVTNARFVDLHDKDTEYDRDIRTLKALCDLVTDGANGKAGVQNVVLYLNVSKDGAQTIVLTSAPAKAAAHVHTWSAVQGTAKAATCTENGSVQYVTCTGDNCTEAPGTKFATDTHNKLATDVVTALGHDFATGDTWTQYDNAGTKTHYHACSRCDVKTQDAAPCADANTNGTTDGSQDGKCDVCGNNMA